MDVSAIDVLIGILLVNLVIYAAYGIRSYRRRHAVVTEVDRAIRNLPRRPPAPKQIVANDEPAVGTEQVPADVVPAGPMPADVEPAGPVLPAVVPEQGRHREIEELMRASTYRLSPDRLARATVPESRQRVR